MKATSTKRERMTADTFLAWATGRPEGERYELVAGEVIAMSPERARHNQGRGNAFFALRQAIAAHTLSCQVFTDGMAVRVDEETVYEPDVMVRCGERLDGDAIEVRDPVIVVEVISPSTHKVDTHTKLADYFRIPSLRHYLIVSSSHRSVIHHERGEADEVRTRIVKQGSVELDPPGLTLGLGALFPNAS